LQRPNRHGVALLDQLGPPDKVVTFRTKPDPLADQLADFGAAISATSQIPENDMATGGGDQP